MKRWIQHKALPALHRSSRNLVGGLTREPGQEQWTALTPSGRWNTWILRTLVGVAGFGILWASFARIDETVQAVGKLEPKGITKEVKAPLGGVIRRILVEEGEKVREGQVLIEMDTTAARAKLQALEEVQRRVEADLALSRGQLGSRIDTRLLNPNQVGKLTALRDEYDSRLTAARDGVEQAQASVDGAQEQLQAKQEALAIREEILKNLEPVVGAGAVGRAQYLKEKQDVLLLRGEVKSLQENIDRALSALSEAKARLANTEALTRIDFSTKVEESEKQLAELSNQISETRLTLQYQAVRSPARGVVFDLKPSAPGYVVNSENPILRIVPTDSLVARIFVTNRDIGFLKTGQTVKVRIDAYPSSEFGELTGSVSSIASDVLPPDQTYNYFRFPVTVTLASSTLQHKGRKLPLLSGMSVNANIILRQRPVIAIFMQQILPFWDSMEKL